MTNKIYNVLFLCTGNSARSILAEGILRRDGAGKFTPFSAGSHPKGKVNPFALRTLEAFGYPSDGFRSKSWDEFGEKGAPKMDFIFTVCDDAAGESCPIWPAHPMTVHWGIADPAAVDGPDTDKERAFTTAFKQLRTRISLFTNIPVEKLDNITLSKKLQEIGDTPPSAE